MARKLALTLKRTPQYNERMPMMAIIRMRTERSSQYIMRLSKLETAGDILPGLTSSAPQLEDVPSNFAHLVVP